MSKGSEYSIETLCMPLTMLRERERVCVCERVEREDTISFYSAHQILVCERFSIVKNDILVKQLKY